MTYANSTALRKALLQWCDYPSNFGASPPVSAGNGTGADDDNRIDSIKKSKCKGKGNHQNEKTTRTSSTSNIDINTCKTYCRMGHWVKDCWRPSGGAYDNSKNNNNNNRNKGKNNMKCKGEGTVGRGARPVRLPKQSQPCRILHRHRALLKLFGTIQKCNRNVGS